MASAKLVVLYPSPRDVKEFERAGQTVSVDGGSSLMNPDFPLALQVPA